MLPTAPIIATIAVLSTEESYPVKVSKARVTRTDNSGPQTHLTQGRRNIGHWPGRSMPPGNREFRPAHPCVACRILPTMKVFVGVLALLFFVIPAVSNVASSRSPEQTDLLLMALGLGLFCYRLLGFRTPREPDPTPQRQAQPLTEAQMAIPWTCLCGSSNGAESESCPVCKRAQNAIY